MGVQVPPRTPSSFRTLALGRLPSTACAHRWSAYPPNRRTAWSEYPAELDPPRSTAPATRRLFGFTTTAELPELTEIIGQDRAVASVDFGMGIHNDGYNIFAAGPTGTGKASTVYDFLAREAASLPAPTTGSTSTTSPRPTSPTPSACRPGKGQEFRKDMEKLVEDLQAAITQAFEGEEYEKQKRAIAQQVSEKQEAKLDRAAARRPRPTASPWCARPPVWPSRPRPPRARPCRARPTRRCRRRSRSASTTVWRPQRGAPADHAPGAPGREGGREALRELDREVTTFAAKHLVDEVCERWCAGARDGRLPGRRARRRGRERRRLQEVRRRDARSMFMGMPVSGSPEGRGRLPQVQDQRAGRQLAATGAPVVTESNPVLQNLVGRVEHQAQFGALVTDFNMIKPGRSTRPTAASSCSRPATC